jgi:DNA-directed RNA polymerase specialized sigma24 family protein
MPDASAPRGLPPELAALSREEFRDLYEATWAYARRLTRSNDLADELTQTAFVLLQTTRRWDPLGKVPLDRHMLGIVKSTLSNQRTSKGPEREAEATEEFTRDVGRTSASAEEAHLDRDDAESRRAKASAVLDALRARLAGNKTALDRLDLIGQGIHKPAEQARILKVPVDEIHRAREATQYHLNRIHAAASSDQN